MLNITTLLLVATLVLSAFKDIAEKQEAGTLHNIFSRKWLYYLILSLFIVASFWKEQIDEYHQDIRDGKMEVLKDSITSASKAHYKSDSIGLVRYLALQDMDRDLKRAIKQDNKRYDSASGGLVDIRINMSQSQSLVNNAGGTSTKPEEKQNNGGENIPESIKKEKLVYWENQLQTANASLNNDNATLNNVQQYHFMRMPSTRKQEISDASNALAKDKALEQRCADSVKYYQN